MLGPQYIIFVESLTPTGSVVGARETVVISLDNCQITVWDTVGITNGDRMEKIGQTIAWI